MHVNSLPDDCLIEIFERASIRSLFGGRRVCTRWYGIITDNVFPRIRKLSILNTEPYVCGRMVRAANFSKREASFYRISNFDLVARWERYATRTDTIYYDLILNQEACLALGRLFTGIREFTFVDTYIAKPVIMENYFGLLLTAWSSTLVRLTIVGKFHSYSVLHALQNMNSLSRLTINKTIDWLAKCEIPQKLNELYCIGRPHWSPPEAEQPLPYGELLRGVRSFGFYDSLIHLNMYEHDFMATQLTRFDLGYSPLGMDRLESLTDKFTAIQILRISILHEDIAQALDYLTRLTRLTDLSINVPMYKPQMITLNRVPPNPFVSVKRVHLPFINPHYIQTLGKLFPSAISINFILRFQHLRRYHHQLVHCNDCARNANLIECAKMKAVIQEHVGKYANLLFTIKQGGVVCYEVEDEFKDWLLDLVKA